MNIGAYPKVRKALYQTQFVVAGALLMIAVGFGAAGHTLPTWYAVTSAVASALWTYLGITAATNTTTDPTPAGEGRHAADIELGD